MTKEEIEKILRSHNDREGFYIEECAEELFKNITPATPLPDDGVDQLIDKHIGRMYGTLEKSAVDYFCSTGTVNGSFRRNLNKLLKEYGSSLLKAQEQRHEECKHLEKREIFENCQCTECGQLFIK